MPRKPKAKNALSAGERVALYEAEREERRKRLAADASVSEITVDERSDISEPSPRAAKKVLPKPQHATVNVDFSVPVGEIRPVHGMCNGPVSYGADISEIFREIGVPYVRFDDTDTAVSAYAVDVSRIFKDSGADPALEGNYDFSYTDKYVEAAYKSGARVIFRLGESRDPLRTGKKIDIPADIDALSRVCVNIIRHYNEGWASGFYLGIEYFEIWSHDCDLTGRELTSEFDVYKRVANSVKMYDENIKVGGMCFDGFENSVREFTRSCVKNRVPLDFLTVSSFAQDPRDASEEIVKMISYVRNLGLSDVEVVIAKWSYIDREACEEFPLDRMLSGGGERFSECRKKLFAAQGSVRGAAYDAAFMLELSRVGEVMTACHYDAQPALSVWCSICDRYGNKQKPFYAFKGFGELYRAKNAVFCESLQIEGYSHTGIYASAALSRDGQAYVMIASFGGCGTVDLRLDGIPDDLYTADVYMLDGIKDLALADSVPVSGVKKRLLLNVSEYGVVFIKIY